MRSLSPIISPLASVCAPYVIDGLSFLLQTASPVLLSPPHHVKTPSDCTKSALQAPTPTFPILPQGKSLLRATSIA